MDANLILYVDKQSENQNSYLHLPALINTDFFYHILILVRETQLPQEFNYVKLE